MHIVNYNLTDCSTVEDGDRIWRILPAEVFVSDEDGDGSTLGLEYTFIASLNFGMKFKVYYADARSPSVEWVALNGYKLPRENEGVARLIFPDLFINGWSLTT